jgi:dephospho-CoA kinase
VIGLTGGIACGKSSVSDILKNEGFVIIDADLISRNLRELDRNY